MSRYWQHEIPLDCPVGHQMIWLGGPYWICPKEGCNQIYVQQEPWFPPGWEPMQHHPTPGEQK